jgi:hypothetical protein
MRKLAVAIALLGSTLPAPAVVYGHDLAEGSARAATAWAGERGVEAAEAPFRRSRVGSCTGAATAPHVHAWRCDLLLVGPRGEGDESFFLEEGSDFGCLYRVTVRFASDEATGLVLRRALFDCTTGRPSRFGVDPPPGDDEQVPDGLPAAPAEVALDAIYPFGEPVDPVFIGWAQEARVPMTPYPVTLRIAELCPSNPDFYCAQIDDNLYFEPIETEDEASGPRRYDFLHELGHLYEFDVFAWSGNLRKRFARAARVRSTTGIPDRKVSLKEKFAEAYASCAFSHRRLVRYRSYRLYGWRPPVSRHRTFCRLIEASWLRFGAFEARPRASRPNPLGLGRG